MRLLITIPVFNERRYVEQVLAKVREYHDQILFIDDGSTDGTGDLLESIVSRKENIGHVYLWRHPKNRGYGQSIIDAFDYAHRRGYDWVITMDCDEQHEPATIPAFIEQIKTDQWDVISGSRYLEVRPDNDLPPGDRRAINATITAVMNGLFRLGITDAFCGFKAHRVSAMVPLQLDETGYAFPLQFWPRMAQAGLRLSEIPVKLIYNDPNRHFGGKLDDAGNRLRHYLDVLHAELHRDESAAGPDPFDAPVAAAVDAAECSCSR